MHCTQWRYGLRLAGRLLVLVWTLILPAMLWAASPVRVAALKFGTIGWELDTIQANGLASQRGVHLEVVEFASTNAISVALLGGAVDVIVTDWIWVSRQRADGRRFTFVPYSLAVGSLVVRPASGILEIDDLRGKRLGVAGGPVDKSWLLIRAYNRQRTGEDLADVVNASFASPPLINQLILRAELDAVINFWHYAARLEARGMAPLIRVSDVLPALGVERPVPLLGWVFHEAWAAENGPALVGFLEASRAAKRLLHDSDEEWQRIRPITRAEDDAVLATLRDAFRQGIPRRFGEAERSAAAKLFEVLAREGGDELVGTSRELSPGTFWDGFEIESWP